MNDIDIKKFISEIRIEHHISPFRNDDEFFNFIKDGVYDINEYCGSLINYNTDLDARRLLKNYVLYADYQKLAEFKVLYISKYDELQRKYFNISNI